MNKKYCPPTDRTKLRLEIKGLIDKYKQITYNSQDHNQLGPKTQKQVFQIINSIGMKYAKDGYLQQAINWLKKAQKFTKLSPKLQIVLHSNFACIFKKKNQYQEALNHIRQAQRITQRLRIMHPQNFYYDSLLIDCWLNLCALLSSQKKHEEALCTVRQAIALLNCKITEKSQQMNQKYLIARYNQVVQLDYLERIKQAYSCIQQTKKFMNNQKIYNSFFQKSFNDLGNQLKKKLIIQRAGTNKASNKHLNLIVQTLIADQVEQSHNFCKSNNKQADLKGYNTQRSSIKPYSYCSQKYRSIDKSTNKISNQNVYQKKLIKICFTPARPRSIMQEIKNR